MSRATYTAQMFLDAIPGTGGIITAIAKRVGCAWWTAKKHIMEHPTILRAWQAERESVLDLCEAKTIEAIRAGDWSAIRYYLSTQGKSRGYTERHEVTGAEGGPIRMLWDDGTDVAPFASGPADDLE